MNYGIISFMGRKKLGKQNKKTLISWGIAILACTLIFIAIELKYPYFFLRDDNADGYIAGYTYAIRCFLSGKFPLYCFNNFGGQRFSDSLTIGIFNPLIIISALLSNLFCGKPDMMIDIIAYLSVIIGCTGAFLLLKKLGCSDLCAIIGSIAWNFNAYNIWQGTSWLIIIYTTAAFPYFLLTSLRLLEKSCLSNIILAIVTRIYVFYLGHPQFFIFAAIFDCIFIGVLCLLKKSPKIKSLFILIKDYLIVYVTTTFLALPLLIPLYKNTMITYGYNAPKSVASLHGEMWVNLDAFLFPFLYDENNISYFYPPFIGYLLFTFLLVGFILLVPVLVNKSYSKYKDNGLTMLAAMPCFIIGFLLLFSSKALDVIAYVPILNKFQYYHRICIFFVPFEVLISCLSMTITFSIFKEKLKKGSRLPAVIKYAVIIVETLFFAVLYTLTPHMGRGPIYDTSRLYDYEFAKQFTGGRYVTAGYFADINTINKDVYDLSENLNYSLALLYGIDSISGYAGFLNYNNVIAYNECFRHMYAISGSIMDYYPGFIEQMREQSVCWYIVSPDRKAEFDAPFKDHGFKLVSETEHSVIYYDSQAQPYAYDENKKEVSLIQDVNSLTLHTDSSFQGGKITLNYAYDPYLKCYIDGELTEIYDDYKNWQYSVNCKPGEHEIIIRFEEPVFTCCCFIALGYIVFAGSAAIIYKLFRKYKSNKIKQQHEN